MIAILSFILDKFLSKIFSVIFNFPLINHSTLGSSKFHFNTLSNGEIHLKVLA